MGHPRVEKQTGLWSRLWRMFIQLFAYFSHTFHWINCVREPKLIKSRSMPKRKMVSFNSRMWFGWSPVCNFEVNVAHFRLSIVLHLMVLIAPLGAAQPVPCFCTENRCQHGYCESPWCLVGVQRSGRVIRTCGSDASAQLQPCLGDVGDWQDVCACRTAYCNTFAFLRHQIRIQSATPAQNEATASRPLPPAMRPPPSIVHFERQKGDTEGSEDGSGRRSRKGGPDEEDVVFDRPEKKDTSSVTQPYLMIVLIIVPLAVAATAIIVVVLGYYCKMC